MKFTKNGDLIILGQFEGQVDFDASSGVNKVTSTNKSGNDLFISRQDSTGKLIWLQTFDVTGGVFGEKFTLDANGNIYLIGNFKNKIDVDPGSGQ